MLEEVLVATTAALEGRAVLTAPGGGTLTRLATARTRPVEGGDRLVVVE